MLIGLETCQRYLRDLKQVPPTMIFLAPKGAGKSILIERFAKARGLRVELTGNKIDDIRELIENSIALAKPTLFWIKEGDELTTGAMNALLKVAEEPPKNCHIAIEIRNYDNVILTIKSRATTITLDNYKYTELIDFAKMQGITNSDTLQELCCVAETPGQVLHLNQIGFDDCMEYANKVVTNILKVSTGNAFNIPNKITFQEEEDKIDVEIFLKVFLRVCKRHLKDNVEVISKFILYTTQALNSLQQKGVIKPLIFDIWILNIRKLRGL